MAERRFPPRWSVEYRCRLRAKDSGGQKLAHVYYEEEPAAAIARTSSILMATV